MQFIKKTSSSQSIISFAIKLLLIVLIIFIGVFLLNKIDFPAPKKEIEKTLSNENFKIIK
tara:strand:+ start:18 stop:197 length:180 start_codon:yes stop_codon:yes gene_type:complete